MWQSVPEGKRWSQLSTLAGTPPRVFVLGCPISRSSHFACPPRAEYERAMRIAMPRSRYPWGDSEYDQEKPRAPLANYLKYWRGGERPDRTPVRFFPATRGLYDISGNFWEWTSDWYDPQFYSTPAAKLRDSRGPTESPRHQVVVGGGSFENTIVELPCVFRGGIDPMIWILQCRLSCGAVKQHAAQRISAAAPWPLVGGTSLWPHEKSTEHTDGQFKGVVENAIDFQERAFQDMERAPKYSPISFTAAVELLLKARLMLEHWSLIIDDPRRAKAASYRRGDFKSVGMEEAIQRLQDIAGVPATPLSSGSIRLHSCEMSDDTTSICARPPVSRYRPS